MHRLRSKSTSATNGGGGRASIEDTYFDGNSPFLLSPLSHQYCKEPRRSEPGIVCSNQDLNLILTNTELNPSSEGEVTETGGGVASPSSAAAAGRKRSITMVSK